MIKNNNKNDDNSNINNIVYLEGILERILYKSTKNNYVILALKVEKIDTSIKELKNKTEIVCTGNILHENLESYINNYFKIKGEFVKHQKYGDQIKILDLENVLPSNINALEKYLYSGALNGIGKVRAKRIVEAFGKDTENIINIIENNPEKLSSVKGISLKKAREISIKFSEQKDLRNIIIELQGYGLTPNMSNKIYKRYKEETLIIIKNNPYRICEDIFGAGFKIADGIAMSLGIEKDSKMRLKVGIKHVLKEEAKLKGHIYLPRQVLISKAYELLKVDADSIENAIVELHEGRQIIIEKICKEEEKEVLGEILENGERLGEKGNVLERGEREAVLERGERGEVLERGERDAVLERGEREAVLERGEIGERAEILQNHETIIFLAYYYYSESYVAKKILELASKKQKSNDSNIRLLKDLQAENHIKLAQEQQQAVIDAMENSVLVVTGGPGTGKTTTINMIIAMFKNQKKEVELCAPTGKATRRMTEATGFEAKTIHRLLEVNFSNFNDGQENITEITTQAFERNEDNPIDADVIIVDECSMIDIVMMCNLLKAIEQGTRLILVGDVDQLPSVGAGNVLRDMIESQCIHVVRLQQIFRQSQESSIIMNAHRINKGEYPLLDNKFKDFFVMKSYNTQEISKTIIDLVKTRLPKYLNSCNSMDIQVLSPMKKTEIGVNNLNILLQEAINPPSETKKELVYRDTIFRENDKVMQIKNNYNMKWEVYDKNKKLLERGEGIFNGDDGIIKSINKERVVVVFDENKEVEYEIKQLEELILAYAITIHKSQGSEYRAIVIPIFNFSTLFFTRNLIYTGVTRAKELVVIVGVPDSLKLMVENNIENSRYTYLKNRIINLSGIIK